MKVILLLAGRSRRFWPLAEKTLFPICGKTMLEHQIERLKKGGVKESEIIFLSGAHNKGEHRMFPKVKIVEQEEQTGGMRAALLSALKNMKNEPIMVVSGNDVIEPQAYAMLRKAAAKKGVDGAILAKQVDRYFPGGYLTVQKDRVTGIVEKPGEGKEPSNLVNIVAHVHNDAAALLAALHTTSNDQDDGYERALAILFTEKKYQAVRYDGVWQPVKYPWHLLPLLQILLGDVTKKIDKSAKIHKTAIIDGPVVIGKNVKVLHHAVIVGPCVIDEGSVIGTNALVVRSSIGKHCVIGYNTEVKGSVLASNVWTHSSYLGDSVIGHNVAFGGGCVTGNFRLDEGEITSMRLDAPVQTGLLKCGAFIGDDSRIGIQVGINPGIKIGEGSFVAGGTFVTHDIPSKSFVRIKDGKLTVSENKSAPLQAAGRNKYRS